jgi:hypothetical protein
MVEPDDIDLEDLISASGNSEEDFDVESRLELVEKVLALGSLKLDDEGRMLISCPGRTSGSNEYVCGIFPVPDPDGDGFKQVCTGPTMSLYNGSELSAGTKCASDCPFSPRRLEEDSNESDNSGGWL